MTRAVGYSVHPATFGRWELIEVSEYRIEGDVGPVVAGRWRDEHGRLAWLRFPADVVFVEAAHA